MNVKTQPISAPKDFYSAVINSAFVPWCGFVFLYWIHFGFHFVEHDMLLGGDSYTILSYNNLVSHSLLKWGEFLWWDPTAVNGWPSWINFTIGWFNELNPFAALGHLFVYILNKIFGLSVSSARQVHMTTGYYAINIFLIIIISRLLIKNTVARLLPPLIITFGQATNHWMMVTPHAAAMAPALFIFWGVVSYAIAPTRRNLLRLLFCIGVLVSSFNYIIMSTFIFPIVVLFISIFLMKSRLLTLVKINIFSMLKNKSTRNLVIALISVIIFSVSAILISRDGIDGRIVRVSSNADIVNASHSGVAALYETHRPFYGIMSQRLVLGALQWAAFDDVYRYALTDPNPNKNLIIPKVDMRYVGVLSLFFLIPALFMSRFPRVVWPIAITWISGTYFLPYTSELNIVQSFVQVFPEFRNIRHIAHMMPRDLPSVCIAVLAGIGLDAIIRVGRSTLPPLVLAWIKLMGCLAIAMAVISVLPIFKDVQHSAGHVALYLGLSVVLIILIRTPRLVRYRKIWISLILVTGYADLSVSSGYYWARVPYNRASPHLQMPTPERFGVVRVPEDNWFGIYGGVVHHTRQYVNFGLREWLMQLGRPAWRPSLENWDSNRGRAITLPAFRAVTHATYIPLDSLTTFDQVPPVAASGGSVYVHDLDVSRRNADPAELLDAPITVNTFTPNKVSVTVDMPKDGLLVYLDNWDRHWRVNVNGGVQPVIRTNFTYKAVELKAGRHEVVWTYSPIYIKWAWRFVWVSILISLILYVGFERAAIRQARRAPADAPLPIGSAR